MIGNFARKLRLNDIRVLIVITAILAFALGYLFKDSGPEVQAVQQARQPAQNEAKQTSDENTVWICSMGCIPPTDKPGNCPVCGMELIPVLKSSADDEHPRLHLSDEAMRRAGIQVAPVERKPIFAEVRMFGQIEYDPSHIHYVTAFMPGVVDRVYVKRAGQTVRWHDKLFDLYSSDLYYTQQELVDVMKYIPSFLAFQKGKPYIARDAMVQSRTRYDRQKKNMTPAQEAELEKEQLDEEVALQKLAAIRHKLAILGLPKTDIDELMKLGEPTGIATIYAPKHGVVIEQNAFEGTFVNTGTPIFTIADPKYVWVKLKAYESDFPWVKHGQSVDFQSDAYPGEIFEGKVVYIDPLFNEKTRTFDVGVIYPDPKSKLRPNMLVRAVIHAEQKAEEREGRRRAQEEKPPLVIPASAPLITGKRAVVYVVIPGEKGVFEGREVILGARGKDHFIVREGLKEGDLVVVNGSFKIDSAVQILAKPSMMNPMKTMEASDQSTAMHEHSDESAVEREVEHEVRHEVDEKATGAGNERGRVESGPGLHFNSRESLNSLRGNRPSRGRY